MFCFALFLTYFSYQFGLWQSLAYTSFCREAFMFTTFKRSLDWGGWGAEKENSDIGRKKMEKGNQQYLLVGHHIKGNDLLEI